MNVEEIATKEDILAMKAELAALIKAAMRPSAESLLSLNDACAYLGGMAPATLRRKAGTFEIASHKCGKRLAFSRRDLDEYAARTRRMSDAELRERTRNGHI